jgi:hypothetical protein
MTFDIPQGCDVTVNHVKKEDHIEALQNRLEALEQQAEQLKHPHNRTGPAVVASHDLCFGSARPLCSATDVSSSTAAGAVR